MQLIIIGLAGLGLSIMLATLATLALIVLTAAGLIPSLALAIRDTILQLLAIAKLIVWIVWRAVQVASAVSLILVIYALWMI